MNDTKLEKFFIDLHSEKLNFKELYAFVIENNIPITFVDFTNNGLGLASFNMIYLSRKLKRFDTYKLKELIFNVIAHEIGHFLSFKKKGFANHLEILSSTDFNKFFEHTIHEEIFAEKFSTRLFYKLNGRVYEGLGLQKLHEKRNREEYEDVMRNNLFGKFTNDLNDYHKSIEQFIIR